MFQGCKFYCVVPMGLVVALEVLLPGSILAAEKAVAEPSWWFLGIGLFGGLAFFLYGMQKMSNGMKRTAGNRMRSILGALTKNRVVGLVVGAFVTMVIQSSSATTVMLVSFAQAGLMSFAQSLGVILGADIGTTITAQLIAFKLTDYALAMVAVGFAMQMFGKTEKLRNIGEVLLGFGILFYGMKLMSDAMKPLRTYPGFIEGMQGLENPFLGLLAGAVFTALVQSSSASTGIVIVLAQQGLISLEAGIPVILGANIGTCITAGLASIGAEREAKRVALAHVLFKVMGVLLFIFWIPQFAQMIRLLGAHFESGAARQIANAHTIFNVSIGLLFLPFTTLFAKLISKMLPQKDRNQDFRLTASYLDEASIATPAIGIDLARRELSRLSKIVYRMLRAVIIPFVSDAAFIRNEKISEEEKNLLIKEIPARDEVFPELTLLQGIDMREKKIDLLEEKIRDYLYRILQQRVPANQATEIYGMLSIVSDLESIGDIIHRNLVPLIAKKKELEVDFSDEGKEEILIYHTKVCQQVQLLQQSFLERDLEKARLIMQSERKYLDMESQYRVRHLERVCMDTRVSARTHEVHMELMDLMKQIIVYSSNIAKTYLDQCSGAWPAGGLETSRLG